MFDLKTNKEVTLANTVIYLANRPWKRRQP